MNFIKRMFPLPQLDINDRVARALRETTNYRLEAVSWEDCCRDQHSALGVNISDVYILEKDSGRKVYTVRRNNYTDDVIVVPASKIAVVAGNETYTAEKSYTSITLEDYLKNSHKYGEHRGITGQLFHPRLDDKVSVRFQAVFLEEDCEFALRVNNYWSRSADDPKNLYLLCTSQGVSVSQSSSSFAKEPNVFYQNAYEDRTVDEMWLKNKKSPFKVGEKQTETTESMTEAAANCSAISMPIGIESMGLCSNAVLLVQVPLNYTGPSRRPECYASAAFEPFEGDTDWTYFEGAMEDEGQEVVTHQARVSMGVVSATDVQKLAKKTPYKRHDATHMTVTVTFYYTVKRGCSPSESDVHMAVAELDNHYNKHTVMSVHDERMVAMGITRPAPTIRVPQLNRAFPTTSSITTTTRH